MRVYVAGPYMPKNCSLHDAAVLAHRNTMRAVRAFWDLVAKGHEPFVPHLSHFLHVHQPENSVPPPPDFWYQFDLTWLHLCEGILMIGDWTNSHGAKLELEKAREWGLAVYFDISEVPDAVH